MLIMIMGGGSATAPLFGLFHLNGYIPFNVINSPDHFSRGFANLDDQLYQNSSFHVCFYLSAISVASVSKCVVFIHNIYVPIPLFRSSEKSEIM